MSEDQLKDFVPLPKPGQPRNVVILFDGTGDTEDDDMTNLCLLKNMLLNDGTIQLFRYQQGIGTYNPYYHDLNVPGFSTVSRTADKAIAWSLKGHLVDPYLWLMENYRPGDKISIFGFSRGAYTARALSGMINALGLLPDKEPEPQTESWGNWGKRILTLGYAGKKPPATKRDLAGEGWDIYSREIPKPRDAEGVKRQKEEWKKKEQDLAEFRKVYKSREVFIDFVGCWDTVNSVGLAHAIQLPSTAKNDIVRVFRHALALDERRARFKPSPWGQRRVAELDKKPRVETDVKEVWFAGCHCDIGGGSVKNDIRPSLHFIALRWMIRECFKMETGIKFNVNKMLNVGLDLDEITKYPRLRTPDELTPDPSAIIQVDEGPSFVTTALSYTPFAKKPPPVGTLECPTTKEAELDAHDALAPLYDQLALRPWVWQPLEAAPFRTDVFQPEAKPGEPRFIEKRQPHLGAGRTMLIPWNRTTGVAGKLLVHKSVQLRLQAKTADGKEYLPAARMVNRSLKKGDEGYEQRLPFDPNFVEWVI